MYVYTHAKGAGVAATRRHVFVASVDANTELLEPHSYQSDANIPLYVYVYTHAKGAGVAATRRHVFGALPTAMWLVWGRRPLGVLEAIW